MCGHRGRCEGKTRNTEALAEQRRQPVLCRLRVRVQCANDGDPFDRNDVVDWLLALDYNVDMQNDDDEACAATAT